MKRGWALLSVVAVLLYLCGCQAASTSCGTTTGATMTTTTVSDGHHYETLSARLTREIDEAYIAEQLLPEYASTVGMLELANTYAAKWAVAAQECYDKLMAYDIEPSSVHEYSSDDLHASIAAMKTNWEQYYQTECENYEKVLVMIYDASTIVGPQLAFHRYELQMEWALQLAYICDQLGIA